MSPGTRRTIQTVVALLVAIAYLAIEKNWFSGGKAAGSRAPGATSGYDPPSASPADAIPGGGLAAHEGVEGGHTLDRHVGRSVEQMRHRLEQEDKREVSTFPDLASADRSVAQALYDRRADVARWLASGPSGNEAFPSRLGAPQGSVLRRGASGVVPGRSVQVVLTPSRRFREGFRIVTAYVTLP